jgi:hypothetical protein
MQSLIILYNLIPFHIKICRILKYDILNHYHSLYVHVQWNKTHKKYEKEYKKMMIW